MQSDQTRNEPPCPDDLRKALRALVERRGEKAAIAAVGISRATLSRALAGLGVRRGTVAQIRGALR
jgi:uncharacterized membrane protein